MVDPTQTLVTIGTTIATTLAAKGIEAPGKTLGQIWDIAIGNRIAAVYEKSKAKHNLNVEDFKSKLINNVSSIPKENIQDPKISIIGPALEASKYYFDEKEIRDMFANLIASSMDSTYNGLVQHSFTEIIKQLSPHDAKLFNSLEEKFIINEHASRIRTNSFFYNYNYNIFKSNINSSESNIESSRGYFYTNEKFNDYGKNYISLSNLKRLGLIDFYEVNELLTQDVGFSAPPSNLSTITYCYITALGEAFKKVCIKDSL